MQFVLGVVACLAYQGACCAPMLSSTPTRTRARARTHTHTHTHTHTGGPLWWAMMHIRHHQYCDKPEDPHSAKQRGTIYAFHGPVFTAHRMLS